MRQLVQAVNTTTAYINFLLIISWQVSGTSVMLDYREAGTRLSIAKRSYFHLFLMAEHH